MGKSEKKGITRPKHIYIGNWKISIDYVSTIDTNDDTDGLWEQEQERIRYLQQYSSPNKEGQIMLHEFFHAHADLFGHKWADNEDNMEQYQMLFQTLFDPRNKVFLNYLIHLGQKAYEQSHNEAGTNKKRISEVNTKGKKQK